jgi:hypothetical protein
MISINNSEQINFPESRTSLIYADNSEPEATSALSKSPVE